MAISYDAVSTGTPSSNSISFSHTVGNGNFRLLVVAVTVSGKDTDIYCSSVKYNGVSLTKNKEQRSTDWRTGRRGYVGIWTLVNPPKGANTVLATLTGGTDSGSCGAISYFGVKQSSTVNASTSNEGNSDGTKNTYLTPTVSNSWVISGHIVRGDAIGCTYNQTARHTGGGSNSRSQDTNGAVSSQQNMRVIITSDAMNGYVNAAIAFSPHTTSIGSKDGLAFGSIEDLAGNTIETTESFNSLE